MKFDKNTFAAIIFSGLFFMIYSQYVNQKYPKNMEKKKSLSPTQTSVQMKTQKKSLVMPSLPKQPDGWFQKNRLDSNELVLENDHVRYTFDQVLGGLKSVRLKNYYQSLDAGSPEVELLASNLLIQPTLSPLDLDGYRYYEAKREGDRLSFSLEKNGWLLEQSFSLTDDPYKIDIIFRYHNKTEELKELSSSVLIRGVMMNSQVKSSFLPGLPTAKPAVLAYFLDNFEKIHQDDWCNREKFVNIQANHTMTHFIGMDANYFLVALLPQEPHLNFRIQRDDRENSNSQCSMVATMYDNQGVIKPGEFFTNHYVGYFGPKEMSTLQNTSEVLLKSLDFGWMGFIARPLLIAIKWLGGHLHNFGLAIIVMTILLKMVFYPLARQSAVSMHKMKKLQPEMAEIRKKFKDDVRMQQQETMRFMMTHKVNPMKGCLPILPQMPVFIAFYQMLANAIELRHVPFMGWIQDLSVSDPYYITPVLVGLAMFAQQKFTPTTAVMDKNQEKIMLIMPLMMSLFMFALPAGMVIYMLTNTLVSIAQQQWLNHKLSAT